jgi:trehalose-phosphatase
LHKSSVMATLFFSATSEVQARIGAERPVLLCLDLDRMACPTDTSKRSLESLYGHWRRLIALPRLTVAIFSAKNRAELQAQVRIPGLVYAGNLGLEISGDGFLFIEPTATEYSKELAELGTTLESKIEKYPGAAVHNKGLTLVIDAKVPEGQAEEIRRLIHESLANANHPFHLATLDGMYEIQARVPWKKAHAVASIKNHLARPNLLVIFLTDDEKDEETVSALTDAVTIKVGGPAQTLAGYRLESHGDIGPFFQWLETALKRSNQE